MKITNKLNLPNAFVEMAKPAYQTEQNEYRVTSLLKGIRETILERRYDDKCEQDVSDMIWLLFGTAVHSILERQPKKESELREVRFKTEIGGRVISGQFDSYDADTKILTDYKTASVWKVKFENFDDWEKQLLIYSYLLRLNGYRVDKAQIVAVLKDHKLSGARYHSNYPQYPVYIKEYYFKDKDYEEITEWLAKRIGILKYCENLPDNELPICTPEERFAREEKWAVKKKDVDKARKLCDSSEEAEEWLDKHGGDYIEYRPGKDVKCEDYCLVKDYCNYYNEVVKPNV